MVRLYVICLLLGMNASVASAEAPLCDAAQGINEDDVVRYISARVRPEAFEKTLDRPGSLQVIIENLQLIECFAQRSLAAGLISQGDYDWYAADAANREAMDRFIDKEIEMQLANVNWDAAARERYLAKPELYSKGEEVNASHILVSYAGRNWKELYNRVAELQAKLDSGEDFYELAAAYSEDPSVERNGGTLGFFGRGAMYPSFEKAAFAMDQPGLISDPVVTSFGVHFIRFEGRREGERPRFEQVAHLIRDDLRKERRKSLRQVIIGDMRAKLAVDAAEIDENYVRKALGLPLPTPN